MSIFSFLSKKVDLRTPILIKVMVVLYAWVILSGLFQVTLRRGLPPVTGILGVLIQAMLLVALWNLRRWSVIGSLVLALYGVGQLYRLYGGAVPTNMLLVTAVFRGFIVVPGLIYWRSMSW